MKKNADLPSPMTKMLIWLGFIETGPKRLGMAKIIAVEPHHMTRVLVVYKDRNGLYYGTSVHQSNTISDGGVTINPQDYLFLYDGTRPYGPLPGCKREYQEYRDQLAGQR